VGVVTGRNAKQAGILKGRMPSRRERKTLRLIEADLVKDLGRKSERGRRKWRRLFSRLFGERSLRGEKTQESRSP